MPGLEDLSQFKPIEGPDVVLTADEAASVASFILTAGIMGDPVALVAQYDSGFAGALAKFEGIQLGRSESVDQPVEEDDPGEAAQDAQTEYPDSASIERMIDPEGKIQ